MTNARGTKDREASAPSWRPAELDETKRLLEQAGLPADDLDEGLLEGFLACGPVGEPTAVGGLEFLGRHALLRSVAVAPSRRGEGLGQQVTRELERRARERGVQHLYLLTEGATAFFERLGWRTTDRAQAPPEIAGSTQFSRLCPASARLLSKALSTSPARGESPR